MNIGNNVPPSDTTSVSPAISRSLKVLKKVTRMMRNSYRWLLRTAGNIGRRAIFVAFMAYLAPELRTALPDYYKLVDMILHVINDIAAFALQLLQSAV